MCCEHAPNIRVWNEYEYLDLREIQGGVWELKFEVSRGYCSKCNKLVKNRKDFIRRSKLTTRVAKVLFGTTPSQDFWLNASAVDEIMKSSIGFIVVNWPDYKIQHLPPMTGF